MKNRHAFSMRLPQEMLAALDLRAEARHLSRAAYLVRLIRQDIGDISPALVLGYVQLHSGELDTEYLCPECHQPAESWWLRVTGDLRLSGPVCALCATSE